MKLINVTIGADPEFAVVDLITGEPKSVVGLLGGTKKRPLSIGKGCSRQEDNVNAEITIPPATTAQEFLEYITHARKEVDVLLNEHWLKTMAVSSLEYSSQELASKAAMEFGCEPSFSVYLGSSGTPNEPIDNRRCAGFHIHLGWEGPKNPQITQEIIRLCDVFLGLPSVLIDPDTKRRELYGGPGEFRPKKYGVEYRSLGAFMLSTSQLILWCYDQAMAVIEDYNNGSRINKAIELERDIYFAIKENNISLAEELLSEFQIPIPNKLVLV